MAWVKGDRPGLWRSDKPNHKGQAHVVIIGISAYPFLKDGTAPQLAAHGGMGQLAVSALTAAKVFKRLSGMAVLSGAEIASCRLLLAPCESEKLQVDRLTDGHYSPADFETIEKAIKDWSKDIFQAGRKKGDNVPILFFSGHGTETRGSPALLASDFLDTNSPNGAGNAVAHDHLITAIGTYNIDRSIFFIDACRDAPKLAKMNNVIGKEILTHYTDYNKSPIGLISVRSTSALKQSFQEKGGPATIFGQALLLALKGPPPTHHPYDKSSLPWLLRVYALERFLKQKVSELIKAKSKDQPVVFYGHPYSGEMLVAEKFGAERHVGPPDLPPLVTDAPTLHAAEELAASRSSELLQDSAPTTAADIALHRTAVNGAGDLFDPGVMQSIFKHAVITESWIKSLSILDANTGGNTKEGTIKLVKARSAQVGSTLAAQLDLRINHSLGDAVWIRAGGRDEDPDSPSFAVAIPRDEHWSIPIRLDVAFNEDAPQEWSIYRLNAWLAEPTPEEVAENSPWYLLWRAQRLEEFLDLASAGFAMREFGILNRALERNGGSPIAAAIAATTLLRCNALDEAEREGLSKLGAFYNFPDGAILTAEALMRKGSIVEAARQKGLAVPGGGDSTDVSWLAQGEEFKEGRAYFAYLAQRGPPLLASTLSFAAARVPFWRRVLEKGFLHWEDHENLAFACDLVERTSQHFLMGGLFAGFMSVRSNLHPDVATGGELFINRRARRARRARAA